MTNNRKTQTNAELRNELNEIEKDSWTLNGALRTLWHYLLKSQLNLAI